MFVAVSVACNLEQVFWALRRIDVYVIQVFVGHQSTHLRHTRCRVYTYVYVHMYMYAHIWMHMCVYDIA